MENGDLVLMGEVERTIVRSTEILIQLMSNTPYKAEACMK